MKNQLLAFSVWSLMSMGASFAQKDELKAAAKAIKKQVNL